MKHDIIAWDEAIRIEMLRSEKNFLLKMITTYSYNTIVEWGSGGSTVLIAENKPDKVLFTSIEHNLNWYNKIKDLVIGVNYLYVPAENNGVALKSKALVYNEWEEDTISPLHLIKYIHTPLDISKTDMFLVDCVARNAVLARISKEAKRDSWVLVHDVDENHPQYRTMLKRFQEIDKVDSLALYHPK